VNAGAGGTESQDWASMLVRMYVRWAEQHGYKVEVLDEHAGEEAGIKSATLQVKGHNAYGWLKTESGVHRLVRISPFDSNARRHTSFASVWVYPVSTTRSTSQSTRVIAASILIVRRARAASMSTPPIPRCASPTFQPASSSPARSERSQHKNRATAWKMLKARLYEIELERQQEKIDAANAKKTDIGWGHQIRSYVLQPYQLVKDLRTGVTSTNPSAVLDGDLDEFMAASLAHRVKGGEAEAVADLD
jgi:peptide chain release factor 2